MSIPKGSRHIRTIRLLRSFHSCPNSTGVSMARLDPERCSREEARLASREAHRLWLAAQLSSRKQ